VLVAAAGTFTDLAAPMIPSSFNLTSEDQQLYQPLSAPLVASNQEYDPCDFLLAPTDWG
jgi:hypothetical protein